jgi:glutamate carboxypeptidase
MTVAELAPAVRAGAADRRDAAVATLCELAALDAPSGDTALLARTAELLEARLVALGGTVRRIPTPAGDHLEARFGPLDGPPAVLVLAHYDTVWPAGTAARRPPRLDGGVVHGPGVFDMRGGIAAVLTALELLRDLNALDRPLTVLLTADEETGSRWSEAEIRRLGATAGTVLVPEPPLPGGRLKTARKGVLGYEVHVTGRASHAGLDPGRGVSAVSELLEQATALEAEADPGTGTTVNIGVIRGGTRPNVIAAEAVAEVDVRVVTMDEYERMTGIMDGLTARRPGASVRAERIHGRAPMERTEAIAGALASARELAASIGIELGEGSAGGASDGNFVAGAGVAVLDGLGPDGGGAHALDEHVLVDALQERVALLALLMARV